MVENATRSAASSRCAAARSWMDAAVTTTASSRPLTSKAMCRLRPFAAVCSFRAVPPATGSGHRVGCGHGLRVDDRSGRAPVPPFVHACPVSQRVMHALPRAPCERRPRIRSSAVGTPPVAAATRYDPEPAKGWHPGSFGGNASRACRRDLPSCSAAAATVPGSPTGRRSATTTDTPRSNVRATDGAGTTGTARSAMRAFVGSWARAAILVITDQIRSHPSFYTAARPTITSSQSRSQSGSMCSEAVRGSNETPPAWITRII